MSLSKGWFKTPAEEEMEVKGYTTVAVAAPGLEESTVLRKESLTAQQSKQHIFPP